MLPETSTPSPPVSLPMPQQIAASEPMRQTPAQTADRQACTARKQRDIPQHRRKGNEHPHTRIHSPEVASVFDKQRLFARWRPRGRSGRVARAELENSVQPGLGAAANPAGALAKSALQNGSSSSQSRQTDSPRRVRTRPETARAGLRRTSKRPQNFIPLPVQRAGQVELEHVVPHIAAQARLRSHAPSRAVVSSGRKRVQNCCTAHPATEHIERAVACDLRHRRTVACSGRLQASGDVQRAVDDAEAPTYKHRTKFRCAKCAKQGELAAERTCSRQTANRRWFP